MSWLQFNGEVWPTTNDEANITVRVRSPNVGCPRLSWDLDLDHSVPVPNPAPDQYKCERSIAIEVAEVPFLESDWRRLEGLEVRCDAACYDRHEYFTEYGRLTYPHVSAHVMLIHPEEPPERVATHLTYTAHDFILRFGKRDGLAFPCEIDAWLLPDEEYSRLIPETAEEIRRFAETPPNFRIITRATFTGGHVEVPRCADPLESARRFVRETTGCHEFHQSSLRWMIRQTNDPGKFEEMTGWRSTVQFSTRPKK